MNPNLPSDLPSNHKYRQTPPKNPPPTIALAWAIRQRGTAFSPPPPIPHPHPGKLRPLHIAPQTPYKEPCDRQYQNQHPLQYRRPHRLPQLPALRQLNSKLNWLQFPQHSFRFGYNVSATFLRRCSASRCRPRNVIHYPSLGTGKPVDSDEKPTITDPEEAAWTASQRTRTSSNTSLQERCRARRSVLRTAMVPLAPVHRHPGPSRSNASSGPHRVVGPSPGDVLTDFI